MIGLLRARCEHLEEPHLNSEPVLVRGFQLPASFLAVLQVANGFILKRKLFRFFGIDPELPALDLCLWNRSPWVTEYGDLVANLVFIAEDIFGDQYGLRFAHENDRYPELVKFWCEGGQTEVVAVESLHSWLNSFVLDERPRAFDDELASAALGRGLSPSEVEHLSFSLPLVVGGATDVQNLEVMERGFHLHLLGQLSQRNRGLPEGAAIRRFRSNEK